MITANVNVALFARPKGTNEWTLVDTRHNLVTDIGVTLLAQMLERPDEHALAGLRFCAVGTSDTVPAVGDVELGEERRRSLLNGPTRSGNTVSYSTFFPASVIPYNLKEMGLWGGPTADASSGTGSLFARTAITFDNAVASQRRDLRVVWAVTLQRVTA